MDGIIQASRKYQVLFYGPEKAKVTYGRDEQNTDLTLRRCTCGGFQGFVMPCKHAVALINCLGSRWQNYTASLYFPKEIGNLRLEITHILRTEIVPSAMVPPLVPKKKGHRECNRIPGNEERRRTRCRNRGNLGHNRRECPSRGNNDSRENKRYYPCNSKFSAIFTLAVNYPSTELEFIYKYMEISCSCALF